MIPLSRGDNERSYNQPTLGKIEGDRVDNTAVIFRPETFVDTSITKTEEGLLLLYSLSLLALIDFLQFYLWHCRRFVSPVLLLWGIK